MPRSEGVHLELSLPVWLCGQEAWRLLPGKGALGKPERAVLRRLSWKVPLSCAREGRGGWRSVEASGSRGESAGCPAAQSGPGLAGHVCPGGAVAPGPAPPARPPRGSLRC